MPSEFAMLRTQRATFSRSYDADKNSLNVFVDWIPRIYAIAVDNEPDRFDHIPFISDDTCQHIANSVIWEENKINQQDPIVKKTVLEGFADRERHNVEKVGPSRDVARSS